VVWIVRGREEGRGSKHARARLLRAGNNGVCPLFALQLKLRVHMKGGVVPNLPPGLIRNTYDARYQTSVAYPLDSPVCVGSGKHFGEVFFRTNCGDVNVLVVLKSDSS